ncbi:hypothetical protein [Nitrospirillum pindoramense]|nr:hypothetical protein [Nitrospirillum amazonense]
MVGFLIWGLKTTNTVMVAYAATTSIIFAGRTVQWWQRFSYNAPAFSLTTWGILLPSGQTLPWGDICSVGLSTRGRRTYVGVHVRESERYYQSLSRLAALLARRDAKAMDGALLSLDAHGVGATPEDLATWIARNAAAAQGVPDPLPAGAGDTAHDWGQRIHLAAPPSPAR